MGLSTFHWSNHHNCVLRNPTDDCPHLYRPEGSDLVMDRTAPRGKASVKFDMTALVRPTAWTLHRKTKGNRHDHRDDLAEAIYIAYPRALTEDVYGLDYHPNLHTFTAAPSPPLAWGEETVVARENFAALDLPRQTTVRVPIWGLIYPCAHTNLPNEYRDSSVPSGPVDPLRCKAMQRLRVTWVQFAFNPVYSNLYNATLPSHWEHELAAMRPWTPESFIDLSADDDAAGATQPGNGERRELCVLSFAAAVRLDDSLRCEE